MHHQLCARTYSTLTSSIRGRSRLEQVIDWVGGEAFDGCIILVRTATETCTVSRRHGTALPY